MKRMEPDQERRARLKGRIIPQWLLGFVFYSHFQYGVGGTLYIVDDYGFIVIPDFEAMFFSLLT